MPVSGEVLEINETLEDSPNWSTRIHTAKRGWWVAIADPMELDDLMDADAYKVYVESLEE